MAKDPFKGPVFWKRWWWQLRFSNPIVKRRRAKSALRLVGETDHDVAERERRRRGRLTAHRTAHHWDNTVWYRRLTPFQFLLVACFAVLLVWTVVTMVPALADRNPLVSSSSRFDQCVTRVQKASLRQLQMPAGVRAGKQPTKAELSDLEQQYAALDAKAQEQYDGCATRTGFAD